MKYHSKLISIFAFCFVLISSAFAQYTESLVYSFGGVTHDPSGPSTGLVMDAAGNLYGATGTGGAVSEGAIYELTPSGSGWTETNIFNFTGGSAPGEPSGAIIFDAAGNIYGVSQVGGVNNKGTVYELSPSSSGYVLTNQYSFLGGSDGNWPTGSLAFDANGNIYGTTFQGGGGTGESCFNGCGTVFQITPSSSGWTEKVIYAFTGGADGASPGGNLLVDKLGSVYGGATTGGSTACGANGCGTIFRLIPNAGSWHFAVIYSFQGKIGGAVPVSLAFDSANNIIGATQNGGNVCTAGAGCGVIFKLTRPTGSGFWKETVLHPFTAKEDGQLPGAVTLDSNGNIFGTCFFGPWNGEGVVWEVSPSGTSYTFSVLAGFSNATADGGLPDAGVIVEAHGNLFGTASSGGQFDHGAVFELSPTTSTIEE